jgi:membrane protease YdiL (CAAX protease family)
MFLHVPRYSGDWMAIFAVFLVGITAGYLTWKSNNLFPAFVLHSVTNLMVVIWWLARA